MSRWKLWKISYWVNEKYYSDNYGGSCLQIITPFLGIIIRFWDADSISYLIISSLEIGWQFDLKLLDEGELYYKNIKYIWYKVELTFDALWARII